VGLTLLAALAYWGFTSLPSEDLLVIDDRPVGEAGESGTSAPNVTRDHEFTISVPPVAEQTISKGEVVVSASYGDGPGEFGLWGTEMGRNNTTGVVGFGVSPDGRWVVLEDRPHGRLQVFKDGSPQRMIPLADWRASDLAIDQAGVVYALDQVEGIARFVQSTASSHIPVPRRADAYRLYLMGNDLYVEGVEDLSFPAGAGDDQLTPGLITRSGTLRTTRSADASGGFQATFEPHTGPSITFRLVPQVGADYAALQPAGVDQSGNPVVVLWGADDGSETRTFVALDTSGRVRALATVRMDGDYGGQGLKATDTGVYELRNSSTEGVQVIRHDLVAAQETGTTEWTPDAAEARIAARAKALGFDASVEISNKTVVVRHRLAELPARSTDEAVELGIRLAGLERAVREESQLASMEIVTELPDGTEHTNDGSVRALWLRDHLDSDAAERRVAQWVDNVRSQTGLVSIWHTFADFRVDIEASGSPESVGPAVEKFLMGGQVLHEEGALDICTFKAVTPSGELIYQGFSDYVTGVLRSSTYMTPNLDMGA
jgi:hypothetical protein